MPDKEDDSVIDVISLEEKLGPELLDEIARKKWKTAPVPSEEELSKEQHKSPKARTNQNSRKNLIQYNEAVSTETKKKLLQKTQTKKTREDVDPFSIIKISDSLDKDDFAAFLPNRRVFRSGIEEKSFYRVLNIYLKDYDPSELSATDIESLIGLAKNKIFEDRLLSVQGDAMVLVDITNTVEKFRKHSEKLLEALGSRRRDRFDVSNKENFSIVDIVNTYDDEKKKEFENRVRALEEEEEVFSKNKKERDKDLIKD